jgi:ADP-ribosylglycohydrolase
MKTRAEAMVFASFVADSLALGVHWIYDTKRIAEEFGTVGDLLPPHKGGYHPTKKKGEFTHYGDQSFHLLQHLANHKGRFDAETYARDWRDTFNGYRGYMDKASKTTLQNMETGPVTAAGSPSNDLGGAARIAPLVYCYRDNLEQLLQAVKEQTAMTHTGSGIVDGALFIASSCYAILHGATLHEAFTDALDYGIADVDLDLRLNKSVVGEGPSVLQAVQEFGSMCAVNAALPGAVYTALRHADNLEQACIETVMAGGDSAARGMVVGMLLGAYLGWSAIPPRWLKALVKYREIEAALEKLP